MQNKFYDRFEIYIRTTTRKTIISYEKGKNEAINKVTKP